MGGLWEAILQRQERTKTTSKCFFDISFYTKTSQSYTTTRKRWRGVSERGIQKQYAKTSKGIQGIYQ